MHKINIAIDGYSSTGKSTIAKELASKLGYIYVDTGAMYRAVTYFAMQNDLISETFLNKSALLKNLDKIHLSFKFNPNLGFSEMYLNKLNVENEIRRLDVSNFVSKIAEIPEVRAKLVEQQQEMGKNKGIVMDGRDIGTVVLPKAELKIFMTASSAIRAKRRYDELLSKNELVTLNDVIKNIEQRDKIDTSRADSPLVQADDAILFDNSNLTKKEQFKKLLVLVKAKL